VAAIPVRDHQAGITGKRGTGNLEDDGAEDTEAIGELYARPDRPNDDE
jgi:hypothetical protein